MHAQDELATHVRLSDPHRQALARLGIRTVRDLLMHFPTRYEQAGGEVQIAGLASGEHVSIVGTLEKLEAKKGWKSRIPMTEGFLRDQTGRIKCRWFNQPYIAKMYADGTTVRAVGKITGSPGKEYLANPELQKVSDLVYQTDEPAPADLFAIYPETKGVSSLWFRSAIKKVLERRPTLEDPIPADLLKKYNLPTLASAIVWIHQPKNLKNAAAARKRFAFEEVFLIQIERGRERALQSREQSFVIDTPHKRVRAFVDDFPFKATGAQMRALDAILADMRRGTPMSRLLEGDVGSGKTAVAATAAYATVETRPAGQTSGALQVAYMAPTEILAKQHFESFIAYFKRFPVHIGLITGSGCYKFPSKVDPSSYTGISRAQLLRWVANGEIPILIGTHALIQKAVQFKHLALVIIDEQHRFGTSQRRELARKESRLPHLLSMTATPIPRTLALTVYGDLDLTLLDEMPPGRKPIITEVVKPHERPRAYETMRAKLREGRQAYVICPRIDPAEETSGAGEPERWRREMKSVKAEAKRLKKEVFPEYEIAILHSKMTPKEKDTVMARFASGEIGILVATSVVEVGVNVPNATMIFIEGAERFGLSQLHQLRGRVMRSTHQAYCFVCPETRGEHTLARLKALTTATNGFELAEADLAQRGPGELSGRKQWGISDIGMEALTNLKLVEAARAEALGLVEQDESLAAHPRLAQALAERARQMHLE